MCVYSYLHRALGLVYFFLWYFYPLRGDFDSSIAARAWIEGKWLRVIYEVAITLVVSALSVSVCIFVFVSGELFPRNDKCRATRRYTDKNDAHTHKHTVADNARIINFETNEETKNAVLFAFCVDYICILNVVFQSAECALCDRISELVIESIWIPVQKI